MNHRIWTYCSIAFLVVLVLALLFPCRALADDGVTPMDVEDDTFTVNFGYTGAIQSYTITKSGWYKMEVWGGNGGKGPSTGSLSMNGGYSWGTVFLPVNSKIYIAVGGRGSDVVSSSTRPYSYAGGWNGGGNGYLHATNGQTGGGGGGATHIAKSQQGNGTLSQYKNAPNSLYLVAGGAGGSGDASTSPLGGVGGGISGDAGQDHKGEANWTFHGTGGTQKSGGQMYDYGTALTDADSYGTFGQGGSKTGSNGWSCGGSGGGGGLWGGGASNRSHCGAGGGSGYVSTASFINTNKPTYGSGMSSTTQIPASAALLNDGATMRGDASGKPSNPSSSGTGYARLTYQRWDPLAGTAYAVLTNAGDFVMFRSANSYSAGANQTVIDLNGVSYTGQVYTGIETTTFSSSSVPWNARKADIKKVSVAVNQTIKPLNMQYWFSESANLTSFDGSGLDTSAVTTFRYLVGQCPALETFVFGTMTTGSATDMHQMFSGCTSLRNLDVSTLDVRLVTEFGGMFWHCRSLEVIDVSQWNTASAKYFNHMFADCPLVEEFDVSHFHTSDVVNFHNMFEDDVGLSYLDLHTFETGSALDMLNFFNGCSGLKRVDLGQNFMFVPPGLSNANWYAVLPTPPSDDTYTGKWVLESPATATALTPIQLRDAYNGSTMAGVYVWDEKYTIVYDSNDGSGNTVEVHLDHDDAAAFVNQNTFVNPGYDFIKWNTAADGTGADRAAGSALSSALADRGGSITLYAQWDYVPVPTSFEISEIRAYLLAGLLTMMLIALVAIELHRASRRGF